MIAIQMQMPSEDVEEISDELGEVMETEDSED
jgi:hypothetical protein